ncbi:FAD FMN-containing dehydrogenase [Liquorilactobacillus sucicola DSM 21376 = JCM 15457]|uniref:FAD FMN-containing dehydrogenase n=2 Tax=Liquorilactobacillus sucicola TaxID=519050 RepID=A0A0R2DUC5_9LACO|nr:FAD FMN-containing dehydrogenase [Liquorilactobacillus sucicola DSM 21376 = JCM 15457]
MQLRKGLFMKKGSNERQWPALPTTLKKVAVAPDDSGYDTVRANYFRIGTPALVIMAETKAQVAETIRFVAEARKVRGSQIPFSVRSGGHGITTASVNNGGVVLDVSRMNKITIVDKEKRLVRIQAGAVWGDVAKALDKYQMVISSGDFGDTGVGGLATAGGIGLLVRETGLTIDHVIGAELVTSNGECHWIDDKHKPNLFWAIRGGSSQVGVVTEFLFKADRLAAPNGEGGTSVTVQKIKYSVTDLSSFVLEWQKYTNASSRWLTSLLMITADKNSDFVVDATNVWAGPEGAKMTASFKKMLMLGHIEDQQQSTMKYAELVKAPHEPHTGQQPVFVKNVLVKNFTGTIINEIENMLKYDFTMGIELRAIGGKLNEVKTGATAWDFREATGFLALWGDKDHPQELKKIFKVTEEEGLGVYGAYSSELSEQENARAWPKEKTRTRLRKIMNESDPEQLFDQGRSLNI